LKYKVAVFFIFPVDQTLNGIKPHHGICIMKNRSEGFHSVFSTHFAEFISCEFTHRCLLAFQILNQLDLTFFNL